jgi:AcrR family transcriptional regulator
MRSHRKGCSEIDAMQSHGERESVPKKVDHDARRRAIAEALLRLAAAEGLEAVSLRQVAAAAGVSMGAVQHYFATKDEMLAFAQEHQARRREQRITARLTAGGRVPTVRELVLVSALEVLPTDEQSRIDYLSGVAFFIRALREPAMAGRLAAGGQQLGSFFVAQLDRAQRAGDLAEGVDVRQEAQLLWSVVDGQSVAIVLGERTAEEAVATVEYYVGRLFLPVPARATVG